MQQLDSSPGVRPVDRSSSGGSDVSFPATAGHGQPRSPGHGQVPQSAGHSQTSRTSSVDESAPRIPSRISRQNAHPSSGDPSRGGRLLVPPTISPSTRPEAISPARRFSAPPFPMWVEQAWNSTTPPTQHTRTIESSNNGPDPAPIQGQPHVDANGGAMNSPRPGLQRPQSIHDPRYYTAADFYGWSPLPQGPAYRNDS